jgi:hypothetical protein
VLSEATVLKAIPNRGFVHDYVHYGMRGTDAHAAYHVGAALATLAQTCPIDYHFPFGAQKIYSNIYALSVGASTTSRKSASISIARDLLKEAVPSGIGDTPGSREALIDSLKLCARQLVMYSEFGSFLASAEKGYLVPLKTAYTEAWDATPISRALVRTRGSGESSEADPRLSMLAGCTLEYLERHTDIADWTGGFMSRFLTFYCKRERIYTIPPGDAAERVKLIAHLKAINSSFILRGQCLGFDAHASKMWDTYYHASQYESDDDSHTEIESAVARAPSQALKIALLLAWDFGRARSGEHFYITTEELGSAIAIANMHTESVLEIGTKLAPDRPMRDRRRVLDIIARRKPKTVSFSQVLRESRLLRRPLMEIIETLMEEKSIGAVAAQGGGTAYYVTPQRVQADRAMAATEPDMRPDAKVLLFAPAAAAVYMPGNSGVSNGSDADMASVASVVGEGTSLEDPPAVDVSAGWSNVSTSEPPPMPSLTTGEDPVWIPPPTPTDPPVTF